jgi:hypothetical protein
MHDPVAARPINLKIVIGKDGACAVGEAGDTDETAPQGTSRVTGSIRP